MKDENLKKLNSKQGEKVSGGYIYYNDGPTTKSYTYEGGFGFTGESTLKDPTKTWEVVDDGDGNVVGRYATKNKALKMAVAKKQSTKLITAAEKTELNYAPKRTSLFQQDVDD